MCTPLQHLAERGQSPWIHRLTRDWIHDREHGLPRLVRCGVSGAVADPVALASALARTSVYDPQIRTLAPLLDDSEDLRRQLVRVDAQQACDVLLETAAGDKPLDGWIAVDIDPALTGDAAATVSRAQSLADGVARPNLLIGVAATDSGLLAIEEATARGLSVLATGVCSPGRYRESALAYRRGLARLVRAGGDPGMVTSVASVPVSALDEKADLRLRAIGRRPELVGTLAVATAQLIRAEYPAVFSGREWERLAALGATPQRCLWSIVGAPDGRQSDLRYVGELVGPDTAVLLTPYSAEAYLSGGRVRPDRNASALPLPAARRILAAHVKAGISPKVIANALEADNVRRGAEAFRDVRALIADKLALLGAGAGR